MWPEGEQTQDLLKGVENGDPSAVNRLMDRHRAAVRRMVQMRLDQAVARRVDASDVVQDVLLEASQRLAARGKPRKEVTSFNEKSSSGNFKSTQLSGRDLASKCCQNGDA